MNSLQFWICGQGPTYGCNLKESAALAEFLVYCGKQKVWGGGIVYNGIIIKVVFEKSMNGYNPGYCGRYSG